MLRIKKDHNWPDVDLTFVCISAVAGFLSLYTAVGDIAAHLYSEVMVVFCCIFLGTALERGVNPACQKKLWLSVAMSVWFVFLQMKRRIGGDMYQDAGWFLSSYLFALPFACLVPDQHRKWWLKFFAAAYITATVILAAFSYMLVLDCLPEYAYLKERVYWDGARLCAFRHPNISACMLMIGVAFDLSFLLQAGKTWKKVFLGAVLLFLLGAMAFTNSRSTILMTGLLLGSSVVGSVYKEKRKQIYTGAVIVLVIIFGVYLAFGKLYQRNQDYLLEKYTIQYQQQQTEGNAAATETIPVYVNPETGEISLKVESAQGALLKDFGSFNGRTPTWKAAFRAIEESPAILLWGTADSGSIISEHRPGHSVPHAHNAWLESLLGLGIPGLVIALIITVFTLRNCILTLRNCYDDVWKRNTALLALCLMVIAVIEPYLFFTTMPRHPIDMIFMLCAGYLSFWQDGKLTGTSGRSKDPAGTDVG